MLPNYNLILKNTPSEMGRGGLGIYIKNELTFKRLDSITFPENKSFLYDCLFIEVEYGKQDKILFGSIYRTPGPIDNFIEDY